MYSNSSWSGRSGTMCEDGTPFTRSTHAPGTYVSCCSSTVPVSVTQVRSTSPGASDDAAAPDSARPARLVLLLFLLTRCAGPSLPTDGVGARGALRAGGAL